MTKLVLAGVAVLVLAGSSAVYAQHRWDHERGERGGWHHGQMRMSAEDRLAFVDARLAAVRAGLKLTPDQDKSWPDIESAVRDFAKQRIDQRATNAAPSTDQRPPQDQRQPQRDQQQDQAQDQTPDQTRDPVARLRDRAERMAATAAGLKRIADAADPLYKTLDEGQKRRLGLLMHMGGTMGGMMGGHHQFGMMQHGFEGDDNDRDMRGGDRDQERGFNDRGPMMMPGPHHGGPGFDRDDGPDRL